MGLLTKTQTQKLKEISDQFNKNAHLLTKNSGWDQILKHPIQLYKIFLRMHFEMEEGYQRPSSAFSDHIFFNEIIGCVWGRRKTKCVTCDERLYNLHERKSCN